MIATICLAIGFLVGYIVGSHGNKDNKYPDVI
jgi:hypothetical protein